MRVFVFLIIISIVSGISYAGDVVVRPDDDQRCAAADYEYSKSRFLNYAAYSEFDNAITTSVWDLSPLPPEIGGVGGIFGVPTHDVPAIDMTASVERTPRDSSGNDVLPDPALNQIKIKHVFFAMSPIGLKKKFQAQYPKLPLLCTVTEVRNAKGERTLNQLCVRAGQFYGVSDFSADFTMVENGCGVGKTGIDYVVNITTNELHIEEIKAALKSQYWGMRILTEKAMDEMFDEELFFGTYFKDLYSIILSE